MMYLRLTLTHNSRASDAANNCFEALQKPT
jgi:hypothetical protein